MEFGPKRIIQQVGEGFETKTIRKNKGYSMREENQEGLPFTSFAVPDIVEVEMKAYPIQNRKEENENEKK